LPCFFQNLFRQPTVLSRDNVITYFVKDHTFLKIISVNLLFWVKTLTGIWLTLLTAFTDCDDINPSYPLPITRHQYFFLLTRRFITGLKLISIITFIFSDKISPLKLLGCRDGVFRLPDFFKVLLP
jgi:hypothetical protein